MFIPVSRSICSDARTSSAGALSDTTSGGTHSAPRKKIGVSLTTKVNPSSLRSTSTVRNPIVARSNVTLLAVVRTV